ncbi:MAG: hypothetical protein AAF191_18835 [Verrucomicrobiota bacterium]
MTARFFRIPVVYLLLVVPIFAEKVTLSSAESGTQSLFLIGNSLTWDTVPSRLDGDPQWHVDCGKSLPYLFEHPEAPCVKTSTLWPDAFREKEYQVIAVQVHYGSTLGEDAVVLAELLRMQPAATLIVHTGWARSAEREEEWAQGEISPESPMVHSEAYFEALLGMLQSALPEREIRRTRAMDLLQIVAADLENGEAPFASVAELYRDKIHMDVLSGRYLMHNAMRQALGQPRSDAGFATLEPEIKRYLDGVLDRDSAQEVASGSLGDHQESSTMTGR